MCRPQMFLGAVQNEAEYKTRFFSLTAAAVKKIQDKQHENALHLCYIHPENATICFQTFAELKSKEQERYPLYIVSNEILRALKVVQGSVDNSSSVVYSEDTDPTHFTDSADFDTEE